MFWGVTLDANRRYTQVVEKAFHCSMAALDISDGKLDGHVALMLNHEKSDFLLCTLDRKFSRQQPLDLSFTEGEEITFYLNGKGHVHLSGYLLEDENPYLDELSDSEDEQAPELVKSRVFSDDDDDDDSDFDDDEEEEELDRSNDLGRKRKHEKSMDTEIVEKKKQMSDSTLTENAGDASVIKSEKKKKKKKKKRKSSLGDISAESPAQGKDSPAEKSLKQKKVLSGGTILEEVKMGYGPEAKPGKMVHVYYTGKLQNGKQFDSCQAGKPFRFHLGKNEVIKGWDTGLIGMKVGGKRKLTIPAQQGYGSQRQGSIPPNSVLVFDVELKSVS